jgi:hypothetical protein
VIGAARPSCSPGNSRRTRVTHKETKSGLGYEPNLYRRARRERGADFRHAGAGLIRVTSANASLPYCRTAGFGDTRVSSLTFLRSAVFHITPGQNTGAQWCHGRQADKARLQKPTPSRPDFVRLSRLNDLSCQHRDPLTSSPWGGHEQHHHFRSTGRVDHVRTDGRRGTSPTLEVLSGRQMIGV